jgi:hypothetical protein
MSIFKIQKFGCKEEIPTPNDINYLINYSSMNDCIVEFEVAFEIPYYDHKTQSVKRGYTSHVIEINDKTLVDDVMNEIVEFKKVCEGINSRPIPV